jgi:glucose-fructose oxidoreductase
MTSRKPVHRLTSRRPGIRRVFAEARLAGEQSGRSVRYAVVGLGHIAQAAVIPAFHNARRNSRLVALFSDDQEKLSLFGRKFGVEGRHSYDQYDAVLAGGAIDAVYIALPNNMHADFAVRAARAGVHVLCEKPMEVTSSACGGMIAACEDAHVKLMIGYRLHFEAANLNTIAAVTTGRIGDPRFFSSTFSLQVRPDDVTRLDRSRGAGVLLDMGVYCINAARYLFRDEPIEVIGMASRRSDDERFGDIDATVSALLRFPGDRLAQLTASFASAESEEYRIVGSKGELSLSPCYSYTDALVQRLLVKGRTTERRFEKRDHFAPELLYFSDCILEDREPEPSGREGLADVRVIEAIQRSIESGRIEKLEQFEKFKRPTLAQEIHAPPVRTPRTRHAPPPEPAS